MKSHAGPGPGSLNRPSGAVTARSRADVAHRRAFLSLLLFVVSFVASFLVGEGLLSLLAADPEDPTGWQVLASGVPALLVFALPVLVVRAFARRAVRLGRPDARSAVLVTALVALAFASVNLLSLVAATVLG
jgi:cytochrome c biogenesis factor